MSYAPVELRHIRPKRSLLGYSREDVTRVLEDVEASYAAVWRERADLADRVEQLEGELARHRDLEQLLRATLMSAERAAQGVQEQAKREAQTIVDEARREAREITRTSRAEREALTLDVRRIRLILHAALEAVGEAEGADEIEAPASSGAEAA